MDSQLRNTLIVVLLLFVLAEVALQWRAEVKFGNSIFSAVAATDDSVNMFEARDGFKVLHAVGVLQLGVLQRLDEIIYDARLRATLPGTLDDRVVIVDIDEKSLAEVGRWPWSRDHMARLVDTSSTSYPHRLSCSR